MLCSKSLVGLDRHSAGSTSAKWGSSSRSCWIDRADSFTSNRRSKSTICSVSEGAASETIRQKLRRRRAREWSSSSCTVASGGGKAPLPRWETDRSTRSPSSWKSSCRSCSAQSPVHSEPLPKADSANCKAANSLAATTPTLMTCWYATSRVTMNLEDVVIGISKRQQAPSRASPQGFRGHSRSMRPWSGQMPMEPNQEGRRLRRQRPSTVGLRRTLS